MYRRLNSGLIAYYLGRVSLFVVRALCWASFLSDLILAVPVSLTYIVPIADLPAVDTRRIADTLAPIVPRDYIVPVEDLYIIIYTL